MIMAYLALAGRIILLAFERIVVRYLGDIEGDKYKNAAATAVFFGIGALFLFPFLLVATHQGYSFLTSNYAASVIYSIGFVFYVLSLATGETSLVTPINSFNVFFLLILSIVFLGESFGIYKLVGILCMFTGVSVLKDMTNPFASVKHIFLDRPCQMMFASAFFIAIGRVIDKSFTSSVDPIIYAFFIYFFIAFNLVVFLAVKGKLVMVKELFEEKPWISIISGFINAFSYLFLLYAMQKIELSIAEPLTQSSTLVTMMLSAIFFKEAIKEKLPGVVLILIGSYMLISQM